MAKQVATTNDKPASDTNAMLTVIERAAMNPDVDVNKMQQLLDMQERIFDKNAEIEFNKAMVRCQRKMRPVVKDAANEQTRSMYARLETIDRQIRPIYTDEGFSLSFGTDDPKVEGCIGIICDLMHEQGHVKRYRADIPIDMFGMKGTQNKTGTHAHGSTMSYGQRYLTKLIFNISVSGEDDDGNKAGSENSKPVTPFQSGILDHALRQCDKDVHEWFEKTYGATNNVPRAKFDSLLKSLRKRANPDDVSRETQENE